MRQVQQIMGMPITIDIPSDNKPEIFIKVFDRFRQIDEKFSTYKPDSEVCKFRNTLAGATPENTPVKRQITPVISGVALEKGWSQELRGVIAACEEAEKWTNGYFSAWHSGSFDPLGYVKGWAIAEAGKVIEKQGYKTYCVSAGGDILARSDSDKIWHIGIQDPLDKSKILNLLSISNGAVATSGSYERGAHIINPKTGRPADGFLSVTVSGPDIIKADILATAVFAMGRVKGTEFMKSQKDYEAIIISRRSRGSSR